MSTLAVLRKKIDRIDEKFQTLLTERACLALKLGEIKRQTEEDPVYFCPEKETEILKRVIDCNQGPLKNEDLLSIFRNIIALCRTIQQPLKIAFLGPVGSFSHQAVITHFGEGVLLEPRLSYKDAFQAVYNEKANYVVAPFENSTAGVISSTLNSLLSVPLNICGEIVLPSHNCLLSRCKKLKDIKQIYSHDQPLIQCQLWLKEHLPDVKIISTKSSSYACTLAEKEDDVAVISSKSALGYYNKLNVLVEHIEDEPNNTSRFYIMGKQCTQPTGRDRTALLFWIPNAIGSLANLLNCFSENWINLTFIESCPNRCQIWDSVFFLEVEGHQEDEKLKKTLNQLSENRMTVKILGSYPISEEYKPRL